LYIGSVVVLPHCWPQSHTSTSGQCIREVNNAAVHVLTHKRRWRRECKQISWHCRQAGTGIYKSTTADYTYT